MMADLTDVLYLMDTAEIQAWLDKIIDSNTHGQYDSVKRILQQEIRSR